MLPPAASPASPATTLPIKAPTPMSWLMKLGGVSGITFGRSNRSLLRSSLRQAAILCRLAYADAGRFGREAAEDAVAGCDLEPDDAFGQV